MDFIKIKMSWLLADLANRGAAIVMDAVPMLPPTNQKAVFTESLMKGELRICDWSLIIRF